MDGKYCWTAWGSSRNRWWVDEGSCLPFFLFPISEQALALTWIMMVSFITVSKVGNRFLFLRRNFKQRSCLPHISVFLRESRTSSEIHQKSPVEGRGLVRSIAHCLPPSCCPQLTPSSLVCIFYLTINSGAHFWYYFYDRHVNIYLFISIYFINLFLPQKVSVCWRLSF